MTATATTASASVIVDSPWDFGNLDQWFGESVSYTEKPVIVQGNPVCGGGYSLKFPLTFRDDGKGYRNELSFKGPPRYFPLGQDYWLGFAIYLPDGWQPDSKIDTLLQFHGYPDPDEGWRNPPIALSTKEDYWHIWALYDSKPNSGNPPRLEGAAKFNLGRFETGRWTKWVMHVRLSYGSDGLLELWKDGEKVLRHVGGNAYNDQRGPYLKLGNYKPAWREVDTWGGPSAFPYREHFFDALRIVGPGGSMADVLPTCGVAPAAPVLE